jgi:D-alanine-D-alanine ligase
LTFPLIVKPIREEASIGIRHDSVVEDLESLQRKAAEVIRLYRQPAIVESFVVGREISVGAIGNDQNLHVFPPLEFLFEETQPLYKQIRSYEYKWGGKKEQMVEAVLSVRVSKLLAEYTRRMFVATECRDYARMDFRVTKDEKIYLLEVNYNPGIGPNTHGLNNTLTKMASFEGGSFEDLIERIILTAARREHLV